jgi:ABC-type Fe3+/spermidine/putrescine transport system ATPase subunit
LPEVRLVNVTKRYGRVLAVDNISLTIKDREYATLLGPSGCGKTTTLRLIAGLAKPDEGDVYIGDRRVNELPPEERGIGFVFQNYALFPHMDLWDNTTYGPVVKGWEQKATQTLATEMLEMVKLADRGDALPVELSGGMQQRAALARALAAGTNLLLLDEPLGALDAKIRTELRYELRRLVKDLGLTAAHVTHDQEEAMTISDRIILLKRGHIEQIGTPEELYLKPGTPFVANFIGESNFFDGKIIDLDAKATHVQIRGDLVLEAPSVELEFGSRVVTAARPENMSIKPYAAAAVNELPGKIERIRFIGGILRYEVRLQNQDLVVVRIPAEYEEEHKVGDLVIVQINGSKVHVYAYPKEGLLEAIRAE